MRSILRFRIIKTICGNFIEDFTYNLGLLNRNEPEFTIDLSEYSLLLIPYLLNWLDTENYDVELMVVSPCTSCNEVMELILDFMSMSSYDIVNNMTGQVAHIILSKKYKQILEEFALFNNKNQTN